MTTSAAIIIKYEAHATIQPTTPEAGKSPTFPWTAPYYAFSEQQLGVIIAIYSLRFPTVVDYPPILWTPMNFDTPWNYSPLLD